MYKEEDIHYDKIMKSRSRKKLHNVEKNVRIPKETVSVRIQNTLAALLGGFVALRLIAMFTGDGTGRYWGIDYGAYLKDQLDIIIVSALPFIAFIPFLQRRAAGWFSRPLLGTVFEKAYWGFGALIIVSGAFLAYNYQIAFAFLGDASYYAAEVFRIIALDDFQSALVKPTSYLTGHLIQWTALTFKPENVRVPFTVLGILGIVLTLWASLVFLRREKKATVALFVLLLLFASGSLMFFGYIELYALTYSCILAYFLACFAAFRRNISVWIPGAFLLVGIGFGVSAIIFLSSYLLLLHWKFRGEGGILSLRSASIILSFLPFGMLIIGYTWYGTAGDNPYLLPLSPVHSVVETISRGWQHYTVFSQAHLQDVLNILLLNAGISVVILLSLLVNGIKTIKWSDPLMLFSLTAFASGIALVLGGNTFLGLGRDWDLMTIPIISVSFLAFVCLVQLHETKKVSIPLLLPILTLVTITGFYTWMRVNLNEHASAQRLEDIVELDKYLVFPMNSYTGLENLRKFYVSTGEQEKALEILKKMYATGYHKLETYGKLLTAVASMKNTGNQSKELTWIYEQLGAELAIHKPANRYDHIPATDLRECITKSLLLGIQIGQSALARTYVPSFKTQMYEWKEFSFIDSYLTPGISIERLAETANTAIDSTTRDAALVVAAARVNQQAGIYQKSASLFEHALTLEPRLYPGIYLELAKIYFDHLGDRAGTIRILRKCIANTKGNPESIEAARILRQIEGLTH